MVALTLSLSEFLKINCCLWSFPKDFLMVWVGITFLKKMLWLYSLLQNDIQMSTSWREKNGLTKVDLDFSLEMDYYLLTFLYLRYVCPVNAFQNSGLFLTLSCMFPRMFFPMKVKIYLGKVYCISKTVKNYNFFLFPQVEAARIIQAVSTCFFLEFLHMNSIYWLRRSWFSILHMPCAVRSWSPIPPTAFVPLLVTEEYQISCCVHL